MNVELIQILFFGFIILNAFLLGRITRRLQWGEPLGQVVGAVLAGPVLASILNHFDKLWSWQKPFSTSYNFVELLGDHVQNWAVFLPIYASIFIFAVCEEFHISRLKETWKASLGIALAQALFSFCSVTAVLYYGLAFSLKGSILAGIIAISLAPQSVFIALNRQHVEGRLKSTFEQTAIFSIGLSFLALGFYLHHIDQQFEGSILASIRQNIFWGGIGGLCIFVIMKVIIQTRFLADDFDKHEEEHKGLVEILAQDSIPTTSILIVLIISLSIGMLALMAIGLPLFPALFVAGYLVSNYHSQYIYDSLRVPDLNNILHLIFYSLLGCTLALVPYEGTTLMLTGAYVLCRLVSKVLTSWIACKFVLKDDKLSKSLPFLNMGHAGLPLAMIIYSGTLYIDTQDTFFMQLIPALLISELIAVTAGTRAVARWKKYLEQEKSERSDQSLRSNVQQISIDSLIQDRVITDVDVRSREDAIKMLTAELVKHGNVSEMKNITQLVLERESVCSTAIGSEVALPHCRTADVEYPMAACAFVATGESIDWDAPDGQPVRFIFLIVSPLKNPNMHVEAMKSITTFIMKPGFLDGLEEAAREHKAFNYLHDSYTDSI